ncbi:hypothetical protein NPS01_25520 [Nocardioides psychrotolerans]|uniref:Rho termination factor, N-terminal domain n=1 Tax=Nocardioides psychrotolerans TaxID=1005945 RepID=A0A1I3LQL2_9ACTN|nr:hypothetical protein [Nocardioides psychrotolerans]GEP38889.1 hypothetical protein NPS01_25520 [Nocardioides psychrotolerans]SFI86973.1 hypothetical protein SAMN05216561_11457 [Nocardioides psychrotolerans]
MDGFTEVYDTRTGFKQRVPQGWLADPVLGRLIKKSPSQRALDGEIGPAPTADSTVPEIREFAKSAEIDLGGATKKDELLAAVQAVIGTDPLPVDTAAATDVAVVTLPVGQAVDSPVGAPTSTDPAPGSGETPATGDEEN